MEKENLDAVEWSKSVALPSLGLGSLKSQPNFLSLCPRCGVLSSWDNWETAVLIHHNAEEIQVESLSIALLGAKSRRM